MFNENDETIKQSTQLKGEGRTKREDPNLSPRSKTQSGSQSDKGTNYIWEPSPIVRSILEKERET